MTTIGFSDVFPDLDDLFKRVIDVVCPLDDRLLQDYGRFIGQNFAKHELLEILSECIDVDIQNLRFLINRPLIYSKFRLLLTTWFYPRMQFPSRYNFLLYNDFIKYSEKEIIKRILRFLKR